VEQILGRILRMPAARRKRREPLNCAYAFVASTRFDAAARALAEGLIASGFEKQDLASLLVEPTLPFGDTPAPASPPPSEPVSVRLPSAPATPLPLTTLAVVSFDAATKTLTIAEPLSASEETQLVACFADAPTRDAVAAACGRRAGRVVHGPVRPLSPSQRGEVFEVPVLALLFGTELRLFEEDDLDARVDWCLAEADADLPGFLIPAETRGIRIDIDETERLQQDFIAAADKQRELVEVSAAWAVGYLVNWLDRSFVHAAVTDAESGLYITRLVSKLLDARGFTMEQLTAHRHRLQKAVAGKFRELRTAARKRALEELLFPQEPPAPYLASSPLFRFDPNKYPVTARYRGLEIPKHYYEVIDRMDGEEETLARAIAPLPGVDCWIRNIEREPETSFWIQTSTDKFYPDFLFRLVDGTILAVEYKGMQFADTGDTTEKERLGELWAARSNGRCHFLMVRGTTEISHAADIVSRAAKQVPLAAIPR
jgi:type III restriction enzyme